VLLAAQGARDDLGLAQPTPPELVADERGLLLTGRGQRVVVGGAERRLPVPDDRDERHGSAVHVAAGRGVDDRGGPCCRGLRGAFFLPPP
jgi:hypothetical protein